MIGKTDLDTAYQRVHANTQTESTCIAVVVKLVFICLRLPFGATPAPVQYTTISEVEIDLGNDLLVDVSWETKKIQ